MRPHMLILFAHPMCSSYVLFLVCRCISTPCTPIISTLCTPTMRPHVLILCAHPIYSSWLAGVSVLLVLQISVLLAIRSLYTIYQYPLLYQLSVLSVHQPCVWFAGVSVLLVHQLSVLLAHQPCVWFAGVSVLLVHQL